MENRNEKQLAEVKQIDAEIRKVLNDIDEVDEFMRQLSDRKTNLLAMYEQLKDEKFLKKSSHLAEQDWEKNTFTWSPDVQHALNRIFKMDNFRCEQLKTINAVLSKNDVLLLAPTGGGKSLCFQLPAVISKGLTIVISPLVSLMENQVWSLKKLGIKAQLLCSTTARTEVDRIYRELADKSDRCELRLLYITPERMAKSKRFMSALQKKYFSKKLDLIAIDEVHCCSQWGHDFRPDYKFLGSLKTMFPDISILGVTATATTKVMADIQKMLNIRECLILKAPFNRPNLYYHIIEKPSEKEEILNLLVNLLRNRYNGMSGIIYTNSIKDTEDISVGLIRKNISARAYHASMDADRRTKIHTKWLNEEIQVVVATLAFGMGIDKSNVRFVIHHTMSKSIENFYQESGRAGRDSKRAECVLMYRFSDIFKITGMVFTERTGLKNAYSMIDYCINGTSCRRDILSGHFTEVWNENDCNGMCDRCFNKTSVIPPQMDVTKYCNVLYQIIDLAAKMEVKLTGCKLIDSWYQKGPTNLRLPLGRAPIIERQFAEQIVAYLIINGYLKEDFHFTPYSTISYIRNGEKKPSKELYFNGTRRYNLPDTKNVWSDENSVIIANGEQSYITPSRNRKRSGNNEISHGKNSKQFDERNSSPSVSLTPLTSSSSAKKSKLQRNKMESSTIARISSKLSRIVTECVKEEAKRSRLFSNSESDDDNVEIVDILNKEEVIVLED